ncbi:hypothetical protein [Streptomyces iconiensis]|uniref:Secreted protein n=1 Tax=Streptomyces iconiensis TaxID=1384038 RepID=A0ABT6ZYD0_9ACTN|nr:hypothetical protein [Streptomyces iconiensis]MDJ1134075.1 hypothetical protein [Streptomyces iconiensis]
MKHRTHRHGKAVAAACALAITTGGLAAAAGTASADTPTPRRAAAVPLAEVKKTKCYTRSDSDITAGCASSKKNRTFTWFDTDGDDIGIVDRYRNGRSTKVRLKVEGYKVRNYSSKGKSLRVVDANFKENREVRIKVCTSFSKKAKCSGWSDWDWT